jgi:hypothetical protein
VVRVAVFKHLIPDDGAPHAETSECGCGPSVVVEQQITYVHRVCGTSADGRAGRGRPFAEGRPPLSSPHKAA